MTGVLLSALKIRACTMNKTMRCSTEVQPHNGMNCRFSTMKIVRAGGRVKRRLWPIPQLRAMKRDVTPFVPANRALNDTFDRWLAFETSAKSNVLARRTKQWFF
jgi:hypothetical protein